MGITSQRALSTWIITIAITSVCTPGCGDAMAISDSGPLPPDAQVGDASLDASALILDAGPGIDAGGGGPPVYVLSTGGNTLGRVELSASGTDTVLGTLSFVDESGDPIAESIILGGIARSGDRLLGFGPSTLWEIDPVLMRAVRLHMATGGWPHSNAFGADDTFVYGSDQFSPFFVIPLADPTTFRQVSTMAFRFESSMGMCISHGDIVSLDATSVYFASVCDSPTIDASSSLVRFSWDGTDMGMVSEIVANLGMLNIDDDPELERAGAITGLTRHEGALYGMTDRGVLVSVRPDAEGGITFIRNLTIQVLDAE